MTQTKKPCKNHPQQQSSRRCYQCRNYICPECQHNLSGHLFCGAWCHLRWKWRAFWKRFPVSLETRMIIAAILVTNAVAILLFNVLFQKIENIYTQRDDRIHSVPVDTAYFSLDTIRQAVSNEIKLRLEANPGLLIGISRNGEFIETGIAGRTQPEEVVQYLDPGQNRFAIWSLDKEGRSSLLDSFTIRFQAPRFAYLRRSLTRVTTPHKLVALTFDGGSLSRGTDEILDVLDSTGVRSTMFLTGRYIDRYPVLVKRMIQSGHEIANHTYNHPHLTNLELDGTMNTRHGVDRRFIYSQLKKADSLLFFSNSIRMAPFWRAPYGEINDEILTWAAEQGYKHIGWSGRCDALDWVADTSSTLYRSKEQILSHFLDVEERDGLNGKIVLMHLGTERKGDYPFEMLPDLIHELAGRGYEFLTISNLLEESHNRRTAGGPSS